MMVSFSSLVLILKFKGVICRIAMSLWLLIILFSTFLISTSFFIFREFSVADLNLMNDTKYDIHLPKSKKTKRIPTIAGIVAIVNFAIVGIFSLKTINNMNKNREDQAICEKVMPKIIFSLCWSCWGISYAT